MHYLLIQLLLLLAGSLMLTYGASFFISGASKVSVRFGVPKVMVGTTIVALGTSLPEFFVSFLSALKGIPDISIGNIVGSNICNIGLILGVSTLIRPIKVQSRLLSFEYPLLFLTPTLLLLFALNGVIGRFEASVFIMLLLVFIYGYSKKAMAVVVEKDVNSKHVGLPAIIVETTGGLVLLLVGSEIFIKAAVNIALLLGVSKLVVGLTLVALGTSLPEFASSIAAVLKKHEEIALGNVIGSNIINTFFIIGFTAFVRPLEVDNTLLIFDLPFMLFLTLLLFPVLKICRRMERGWGVFFIALYMLYIILAFHIRESLHF